MANDFVDITVYNKSQVPVARGRHVFAPRRSVSIRVKSGSQLSEIRACTDLRVTAGSAPVPEEREEAEESANLLSAPNYSTMTSDELREAANLRGLYIPAGAPDDEVAAALAASDGVDPRRTVYTGLTGDTDTVRTGLAGDEGSEEVNESGVMYEERDVPALVAMMVERGITVPDAATKEELIDALKQADGDPGSNVNRRVDDTDIHVDPMNVAKESGMVTLPEDVPAPPPPGSGGVTDIADYNALTVPELRARLRERGLTAPTTAKKSELIALLTD